MKIKPGQFEATHYTDQDRIRLGDPGLRKLEWIMLILFVLFVVVSVWGFWVVWKMK